MSARPTEADRATHLRKDAIVLCDLLVGEPHRCCRLDCVLPLLLLFIWGRRGSGGLAAYLAVTLEACLKHAFDEVVRAQDVAGFGVLDHPVGEARDVARGLKDRRRRHNSWVNLEHVLLDDEVLSPFRDDVRLQGRARWAVVVQAGDACGQIS
jgi:hypothetical protein